MKFKIDENLPAEVAADLRAAGHDVDTVFDEGLAGTQDSSLLERAQHEERVFLTLDKGIANVQAYPPKSYSGIILFRPRVSGRGSVAAFLRKHLPLLLSSDLTGRLVVVSDRSIRRR